jgi:hypothetical protein
MRNDFFNDKTFLQTDFAEAPAGLDRRAFLMRSAAIGAAAVLTGCTAAEKAKDVGGATPPPSPRLRAACHLT